MGSEMCIRDRHKTNKSRFLMILGVPPNQGKGGKRDHIVQMASRAYSITPYCQIPGTKKPGRLLPGTRKAGILASWQLGVGIAALQEAKMCTETPKLWILGCHNIDFLMFLVPCQHGANIANNTL